MGWWRSNCFVSYWLSAVSKPVQKGFPGFAYGQLRAATFYRIQYGHRLFPINTNTNTVVVKSGLAHKWKAAADRGRGTL
jgi:hypothetical protein